MIKQITIITNQGVKIHEIGNELGNNKIVEIKISDLWFRGEPYEHYYDIENDRLTVICKTKENLTDSWYEQLSKINEIKK